MALVQPLGAILGLWGIGIFLLGVRNWWTLGLLVAGVVGLTLPGLVASLR